MVTQPCLTIAITALQFTVRFLLLVANPADGRGQWATTINVQSSGGDITPDNMPGGGGAGWLLISGPSGNRFLNKWNFTGIGQGALNAINDVTLNAATDMGLNMSGVGYYTFVMRDVSYVNSQFYVGVTANAPVSVTHTAQSFLAGAAVITITTGGTPSTGENIYVRYRTSLMILQQVPLWCRLPEAVLHGVQLYRDLVAVPPFIIMCTAAHAH